MDLKEPSGEIYHIEIIDVRGMNLVVEQSTDGLGKLHPPQCVFQHLELEIF